MDSGVDCESQRDDLIAHGLAATDAWTTDYLVGLALDAPAPARSIDREIARDARTGLASGFTDTVQ